MTQKEKFFMSDTGIFHIIRNTPSPEVLAGNATQIAAHGPQINTGDDDPLLVEIRADNTTGTVHVDIHYEDGRRAHLTLDATRALHVSGLLEEKAYDAYTNDIDG